MTESVFWVYGRANCPYCDKAIELLKEQGYSYKYHDIKVNEEKKHFVFTYASMTGEVIETVPQIYEVVGKTVKHVGGYDDLRKYLIII